MTALLEVSNLTVRFAGIVALSGVSLSLGAGEILALIGPNGAGKSTLINCVTGFQRPSAGSIALDGRSIAGLTPAALCRAGIARTFQTPQLFDRLSVEDSVRLAHDRKASGSIGVAAILALAGLEKVRDRRTGSLPYGQQRLAEVARALACAPRALLLDEPAAGLAGQEAAGLIRLIRRISGDLGVAVLLVEHNMALVRSVSDRIVVMHHGEVLAQGHPGAVLSDPAVVTAYLGSAGAPVAARA